MKIKKAHIQYVEKHLLKQHVNWSKIVFSAEKKINFDIPDDINSY